MDEGEKIKNIYITTPIYYVNSEPHIGGVYTTLMADIVCIFNRLSGRDTWFLTGTDEHGQKIQQSARSVGMEEQKFVDTMAEKFIDISKYMKFTYSDFIRTTEARHIQFVQAIWEKLVKNGWVYRGKYSGWYCVSDEAYYTEEELVKSDGGELRTILNKPVEWKEEEAYFFKLSKFQKILLDLYCSVDFIRPSYRKNEVVAFVSGRSIKDLETELPTKSYLRDLSISRNNFSWGIKIPCDCDGKKLIDHGEWITDLDEDEKHVVYVWLDALFNYQSALDSGDLFRKFWKNADIVHIVGKDILRFHAVYWPAFLIALEYREEEIEKLDIIEDIVRKNIIPSTIFAHGWWTKEGKKISKSGDNYIGVRDEVEFLSSEFGIDEEIAIDYIKYYLATETSFGADIDYSRVRLIDRINGELVNNIGNLIQRTLMMLDKNYGVILKKIEIKPDYKIKELLSSKTINVFDFLEYKNLILTISTAANGHLEQMAPWNLLKNNKLEEVYTLLCNVVQDIIKIAILLQVFCPYIAEKILNHFNIKNSKFITLYNTGNYIAEQKLAKPNVFFPKLKSSCTGPNTFY
ncbi:MAG: methionine--tRNA ligase [Rickettsiales bacterium]|nr:methionine--tRNA ligase [Rickettsiales bacterium]